MRTSVPSIYAIGDVNGLCMLAHAASAQARVVALDSPEPWQPDFVPSVVFTIPEAATVGRVSPDEPVHVIRRNFASLGKACAMGQTDGTVKITVRDSDNSIVAISIIGPHASDLIAEATILVRDRCPIDSVATRYIHAHPTLSEIFA